MRFVGNIIYLVTGGIVLALGWLCAALLFWVLVVTRPLAGSCLQVAGLCLWPAGREVVRDTDVQTLRRYIRTGERSGNSGSLAGHVLRCVAAILWLPFGSVLMLGHFLHAGLMVFPIFTNGWTRQDMGLAGVALFPFGASVAPAGQARIARHVASAHRNRSRRNQWMLLGRPLTAVSAAGLIMWVPSDNQAHAPPAGLEPQALRDRGSFPYDADIGFTNFDGASGRPQPGPPPLAAANPAERAASLATGSRECVDGQPTLTSHLSRRNFVYGAQPLGSLRIPAEPTRIDLETARHLVNIDRWVDKPSLWQAKAPGRNLCRGALLRRIAQASTMPVSRKARAAEAVLARVGNGALHAQGRSVAPLDLGRELQVSAAAPQPMTTALATPPAAGLAFH